jgi:hypothetical protein
MTREKKMKRTCNVLGGGINALGLNINGGIDRKKERTKNHSLKCFCTLYLCVFLLNSIYKIINSKKKREIFLFLINYVTSTAKKKSERERERNIQTIKHILFD